MCFLQKVQDLRQWRYAKKISKWEHFRLRAKKNPLRNHLKGLREVPGGFEPPYTVLQTAD